MRILLIKIFVSVVLVCTSQISYSQQKTDANFLFKMWFYIEHVNRSIRTENDFPVKDSSLFALYDTAINLKFDTLTNTGFPNNYIFLAVVAAKDSKMINDSAITYNKTNHLSYTSIPVDYCNGYVLCINKSSGRSYRIQGFYGNDFLSLLHEVKEEFDNKVYNKDHKQTLSSKIFFKNYSVEGIDFKCIYKGIKSGGNDIKKYPCLTSCENLIITVH